MTSLGWKQNRVKWPLLRLVEGWEISKSH